MSNQVVGNAVNGNATSSGCGQISSLEADRIQTHARSILEGEGQDEHDPALVEAVAESLYLVSAEPEHGDCWAKIANKPWGDNFREHARAALSTIRKLQAGE